MYKLSPPLIEVKLSNKTLTWSVQKQHYKDGKPVFKTVFFQNIGYVDKTKYIISKQQNEINNFKKELKKLREENNKLRKKLGIGNVKIV